MSAPRNRRPGLLLLLPALACAAPGAAQDGAASPVAPVAARSTSSWLFGEDSLAYYTSQLVRRNPYQRNVTYSVYFRGTADTVPVPQPDEEGRIVVLGTPIARLSSPFDTSRVSMRVCLDEVCRVLARGDGAAPGGFQARATRALVEVQVTEPLSGKEDVYLELGLGTVQVIESENAAPRPSPALSVLLPRLGDRANTLLGGASPFRMNVSPLTQPTGSGQVAVSVDFEGGIHRYASAYRYGLRYSGDVATAKDAALGSVKADLELERNLQPSSYLPVRLTAGAEADQSFEVANAVVSARVLRLLPFNLNYSPRDEGYIPNTGPLLTLTLEGGWNVRDDADEAPDTGAVAAVEEGGAPSRFTRPGYSLRWKVPVGRSLAVRIDHDGRWAYEGVFEGRPEYHPVWDAGLEYRLGEATYFLGYRRGEAPPLFRTVKATSVGLVFGIR